MLKKVVQMTTKKRYTISDIAKAANVSTTTISRYLNGHHEYMSKETQDRIRFIIENCGYRPSAFAKGLKLNRSNLIGIILPVASTNMSSHFIHRICMACAKTKYNPLFMSIEMDEANEIECLSKLLDYRVDGIISITGTTAKYIARMNMGDIPFVACDRPVDGVDCIYYDHYNAVRQAIRTLYEANYTNIAMFTTSSRKMAESTLITRENAYEDFCKEYGIDRHFYVIDRENRNESIGQALEDFANRCPDEKKLIFTTNQPMLTRTDWLCHCRGYSQRGDMALLGYALSDVERDEMRLDSNIAGLISIPFAELASKSLKLLVSRIEGEKLAHPQTEVLEPQIEYYI